MKFNQLAQYDVQARARMNAEQNNDAESDVYQCKATEIFVLSGMAFLLTWVSLSVYSAATGA